MTEGLHLQGPIAFDTETHPFGDGNKAPPIVCLQYDDGKERNILLGDEITSFAEQIFRQAGAGDHIVVGQNVAFDMSCLANRSQPLLDHIFAAYDAGNVQCTYVRERLLDIAKGQKTNVLDLGVLAQRHRVSVLPDKSNVWRTRYCELEDVPLEKWPQSALDYALDDPTATLMVYLSQSIEADEIGYENFEVEAARQAGFAFALYLMGVWGMRTDQERVAKLLIDTTANIAELVPYLEENGVMVKGKKKTKAIQARVQAHYDTTGGEPKLTPTGALKTDKETLKACHDEVLDAVFEHIYLTKLRNNYGIKLMDGINGNIHARLHVLGAKSGRTSISGYTLQNQSKKGGVRECFVPRPGNVFISADYDAQEVRTLGQACKDICGYSVLADKFRADPDFDPHTAFAAGMLGLTYEAAMLLKEAGDERVLDARQRAKAANFGFPGGLGARAFISYARGYDVILNLEEAEEIKRGWFEQWPEVKKYFDHVQWVAQTGRQVHLRSGRINGDVWFTNAANGYFQGLASECSKTAAYLIAKASYQDRKSPLYGCRPVVLVHDEMIIEAPESYAHEAAQETSRLMVKAMEMWCPDVPSRATPVLSRCWSKKAKPIYDANGRLVPWTLEDAA